MAMKKATDVFHDWALNGRDKGMEKGHSSAVREMLDFVFDKSESRDDKYSAIDVGCGNGWVVRLFKRHNLCKSAEGIDGAKAMIEKAKQIDPAGNYNLCTLPGYVPGQKFDILHSMEFMYYLEDPISMLKEFYNDWVEENGWVVIGVDHYRENEDSLRWPEQVGVNMTTLSKQQWIDAWQNAGFTNISSWQAGEKSATLVIAGQRVSS
jgi:trans-aconitate methyltransferase